MDDDKRTIMVAALSAYAGLLAARSSELDLEQGKGKGKASDDDVDLTAVIQNQVMICGELSSRIADASSGKDIARTFELAGVGSQHPTTEREFEGSKKKSEEIPGASNSQTETEWWADSFQDPFQDPFQDLLQDPYTSSTAVKPLYPFAVDNKPYNNPFTGLPIIPETGFEAGPSSRPPPPLREPLREPPTGRAIPKRTLSIPVESKQGSLIPPLQAPLKPSVKIPTRPPKPLHLQSRYIAPLTPTLARCTSLPLRESPLITPLAAVSELQQRQERVIRPTETLEFSHTRMNSIKRKPIPTQTQQLQRRFTEPPTTPEYGTTPMGSVKQKPDATGPRADMFSSEPYDLPTDISSVSLHNQPPTSQSDLKTNIQDSRKEILEDGIYNSSPAHKHKYLRNIADLASRALIAAGSMISMSRTPSVHQSRSLSPPEAANAPVGPPDYTSISRRNTISCVASRQPVEIPQQRVSEESLPPAYDTLSQIVQRSSRNNISSLSSRATSQSVASSTSLRTQRRSSRSQASNPPHITVKNKNGSTRATSTTSLFNKETSFSLTSRALFQRSSVAQDNVLADMPLGGGGLRLREQSAEEKHLSRRHREAMVLNGSVLPIGVSDINESEYKSPVEERRRSVASPGVKSGTNSPNKRDTVSSTSKPPATFRNFKNDPVDSSSSTIKGRRRVPSPVSPPINSSLNQRTSNAQKRQPIASSPQNDRNSSNPWKDHMNDMMADIALARALQQEEYRALQTERDQLLAYSISNGTAEDDDIELAYYMSLETVMLIELTEAVTADPYTTRASTQASSDPRVIDREIQLQSDLLEARKLDVELRAEDVSDEASLSAAKRLQAELDKKSHDENTSWEEWKKSNIEECIVCGDEQHREELARPCQHGYCNGCLQEGFEAAMASKTPFKCCQKVLDINDCPGLQSEFVAEYEEMTMELSTPNPMYCHNARCAKFLPPRAVVGDIGTCDRCKSQTCRHCKQQAHPGTFCQEDKETEAVKNLGRTKGWKTCPGCNHLIERQSGCLHIVCSRCQTAFCYRCSKRWKDCESTCPDPVSASHPKI